MPQVVHIYLASYETDTSDVVERWVVVIGGVSYSLMSHLQLTKDDARLHLINAFTNMGCKNGYGFGSPQPVRVWTDDYW